MQQKLPDLPADRVVRQRRLPSCLLILAMVTLTACGGGGGGDGSDSPGNGAPNLPPQVSTSDEFVQYVQRVIASFTGDDSEPLDVDTLPARTSDSDEPLDL